MFLPKSVVPGAVMCLDVGRVNQRHDRRTHRSPAHEIRADPARVLALSPRVMTKTVLLAQALLAVARGVCPHRATGHLLTAVTPGLVNQVVTNARGVVRLTCGCPL